MQSMLDFHRLLTDVYIGWPGKVNDARVFVNSSMYQNESIPALFPYWKRSICGVEVTLLCMMK